MTVDTSWELQDDQTTYTVDGLVASKVPTLVVGETVTLEFYVASGSDNASDFEAMKEYPEFITDKSTDYGTTFDGIPWYRFSTYPGTIISSFVFEVRPADRIPDLYDFWGLLVDANETSRLTTSGGRMEMTFFIFAEADKYTRTEIEDNFKADL